MDATTPDAIVRTWFEEVWNQGRADAIHRLFAADGSADGRPGGALKGPAAFDAVFQAFRGAFPDIRIEVERTVTEGEWTTAVCRVTGTHTGNSLGIEAAGRPVEFWGTAVVRVSGGQIREGRNCFDFLTMYQQLGVVPAV